MIILDHCHKYLMQSQLVQLDTELSTEIVDRFGKIDYFCWLP